MPQLQPRLDDFAADVSVEPVATRAPVGEVTALGSEIAWADSPARLMHERLLESFATPAPRVASDRYPMLGRFAVIAGGSIALWALIGWGIAAAVA